MRAAVLVSDTGVFPTTETLAGKIIKETKAGDVYDGRKGELSLTDMLDNIPVSDLDLGGEKGIKADQSGVKRLKERQSRADEQAYEKYVDVLDTEAQK